MNTDIFHVIGNAKPLLEIELREHCTVSKDIPKIGSTLLLIRSYLGAKFRHAFIYLFLVDNEGFRKFAFNQHLLMDVFYV